MRTSAAGRALIEAREGRRLHAYRDAAGVLTIGVGHTGRMSPPPVTPDMTISDPQCDAMLAADLAPVEEAVTRVSRVPLSQNEFDALVSLGFNIGVPALRRSRVMAAVNAGDFDAAADGFLQWSRPPELIARRRAERAQFKRPAALANGDASEAGRVAAARGAVLADLSAQTSGRARRAQTASGALICVGTAGAAAARPLHAAPGGLVACLILAAGVALAIVAFVIHRRAVALRQNAEEHVRFSLASGPALAAPAPHKEGISS